MTMNSQQNRAPQISPQGFDIGELIKQIVPIVLSTLSAGPQGGQGVQPQFSVGGGFTINPFASAPGAMMPQGFDFGNLIKTIVPIVISVLSAAPQGGLRVQPQSSGAVAPQGFDFGELIKQIVPIVLSTLSAGPQGGQGVQPQFSVGGGFTINPFASAPGAMMPQGFDFGNLIKTIVPIVISVLSAAPQGGARMQPQSSGAVAPQGFDFAELIKQIVPIVLSTLSAGPQGGQGVQPQFSVGGGFTMNPFASTPESLMPQGLDFGNLISAVVPIILSVLSTQPQPLSAHSPMYH